MKRALLALVAGALTFTTPALADVHRTTLVLVVDASASMVGDNISAVRKAVATLTTTLPAGAQVGLVTFSSRGVETVEPDADPAVVLSALGAMQPSGGTALYDGITTALDSLADPEHSRLVVVTDGFDTSSTHTIDQVRAGLTTSGVLVDIVTVAAPDRNLKTMKRFTDAAGGRVFQAADSAELQDVMQRAIAQAMPSPSPSPTPSFSSPSSATPIASQGGSGNGNSEGAGRGPSIPVDVLVTFAVSAGVLVASYWLIGQVGAIRRRRSMANMLHQYAPRAESDSKVGVLSESTFIEVPDKRRKKTAPKRTAAVLYSRAFPLLADRLTRADLPIKPEHFVAACAGVAMVLALIFQAITGSVLVAIVLSSVTVMIIQAEVLKFLARRFMRSFESSLPDFLTLISSGLRSGMSMPQSVSSAAGDGNGPVERQVRRALAEVKVGLTIDEALMRVAQRMNSDDLRWAIAALQIQREVGGNLSKILDTAAATIRARDDLRREIATLSAEGRISAYVLVALPIGIFLFMMASRRDYVEMFWTTGMGKIMMIAFVAAVGSGWLWMRKLVVVEV